jgi:type II/III secretion system protein
LVAGVLAAFAGAWAQVTVLEVIPLKYRTAEQVLPVIQPMLAKGGTASGLQGQLVIRTTPGNLEEIRRILASIDTMPRRLLISVRQDAYATYGERGAGVSGRVGTESEDRLRARVVDTASTDSDRNTQTVQVMEGSPAFIRVGQSVPVQPQPQPLVRTFPGGGRVVEQAVGGVEYRDVTSGFYALPRVAGDRVTLDISAQREALSGQVQSGFNVQNAVTTVSGRLGEWIEVAGTSQSSIGQQSVLLGRTAATASDTRRVLVKVEELK